MLIKEYALEPQLLTSWDKFQRMVSCFGIEQGRLISRFPKHWKRMVIESLGECQEIERKRIVSGLERIDGRMLPREHEWNASLAWLSNAENEHQMRPFHSIIARENPTRNEDVLVYDEIDDTSPHTKWASNRSCSVARRARDMAAAVSVLLKRSKTIVFIDPHFNPNEPRYQATLEEFLSVALRDRRSPLPSKIEYHVGDNADFSFFDKECRKLSSIIPQGIEIHFVRWKQKQLHNRFILTDRGGVSFPNGLDADLGSVPISRDLLLLLDEQARQNTFEEYAGEEPKYTPCPHGRVVVRGAKPL